jgi:hypothetical protein
LFFKNLVEPWTRIIIHHTSESKWPRKIDKKYNTMHLVIPGGRQSINTTKSDESDKYDIVHGKFEIMTCLL